MNLPTKNKNIIRQKTNKPILFKFITVFLLFLAYFFFISWRYGMSDGFLVTFLTWSVFVLCTPIAEAGLLLDLPLRLLFKIRMVFSEILVWIIAITLNIFVLIFNSDIYGKTDLLVLFKHILINPIPFWFLIVISGIGTFVSIMFGDDLLDAASHSKQKTPQERKKGMVVMFFLLLAAIVFYYYLIKQMGISF
ncbi:MAG: hypothetical protein PHU32_06265 [Candidatus ainarchaeum sp.]|nr:hypothetical protein [Candidatus ainarchaeum sp.]